MNALPALAVLACPVGMALMMWFGMRRGSATGAEAQGVDDLRAQHQRLGEEIARLENERTRDQQPTSTTTTR